MSEDESWKRAINVSLRMKVRGGARVDACPRKLCKTLRLTFPRAKLRRQIFMTQVEVWAKNWAKFSAHFRASFAVQNDRQIFSQNSSQFVTPCLVAENMKFHLRELLGFGGRNKTCVRGSPHRSQKTCARPARGHQKKCRDCAQFVRG